MREINLVGKCGSCRWGNLCKATPKGLMTNVKCNNPVKKFKHPWNAIHPRSRDACAKYEMRESYET